MGYASTPIIPYDPASQKSFLLSRSKIELFFNCPRCFYLEVRHGIRTPPPFPYTLNSTVDKLLRNEFTYYREHQIKPPLLAENNINSLPAILPDCIGQNGWQWGKISYHDLSTNFVVFGYIDDLWVNENNEYEVVDYKATANVVPVTNLDRSYHISYKRQAEIYQWILKKNKLPVSKNAYFVFATANPAELKFAGRLNFTIKIIFYTGKTDWIDNTLNKIKTLLHQEEIPAFSLDCKFCEYQKKLQKI